MIAARYDFILDIDQVLVELVRLAEQVGLDVQFVRFDRRVIDGPGGVCKVRDRHVVMIDAHAPFPEQVAVLAKALAARNVRPVFIDRLLRKRIARVG
jgi:hypothetical protein